MYTVLGDVLRSIGHVGLDIHTAFGLEHLDGVLGSYPFWLGLRILWRDIFA